MALGKLSAGLAHELNNPASAMVRSAHDLRQIIHKTPESFKAVLTMRISHEQTDAVNEVLFGKINSQDHPIETRSIGRILKTRSSIGWKTMM